MNHSRASLCSAATWELRENVSIPTELRLDGQVDSRLMDTGMGAAHPMHAAAASLGCDAERCTSKSSEQAPCELPAATGTRWRREIAARQGLQIFLPSMGGLTNLSPLPQVLQPGACKFKR